MPTLPATYRAYQFEAFGDASEVVTLRNNVKHALLTPSDVRIKVHSAALNPVDYKSVEIGASFFQWVGVLELPSSETPFNFGMDAAGVIVEVGSGVTEFKVGDVVYVQSGFTQYGSLGEYFVVNAKYVAPKPKNLSFNEAAGVPLVGQTSWNVLFTHGKLKKGERVLILGGSSATGAFGIQLAKAFGAYVIATTSFRNTELVKSLGADQVIDYTKQKWFEIDLIYDTGLEQQTWNNEAQTILKKDVGRFLTILALPDPIESPIGATFHHVLSTPSADLLKKLTEQIEAGKVVVPIDSVHSFENVKDAIKIQQSGRAKGKIIVEVHKD
uniref:Enoyl reductase (ER) domain-containing protein n=1 Tax=Globisporangium ultimum (strain ATCC 200006 / CBS 805.95 / DAOM BR144) TaxID=431595 RepID=K3XCM5_GLOUD